MTNMNRNADKKHENISGKEKQEKTKENKINTRHVTFKQNRKKITTITRKKIIEESKT